MSCEAMARQLPGPSSLRAVAANLCSHERMTMKQLQESCGLARRTVYGAVRRLRELGLVVETPSLADTRQTWISLR